MQQKCPVCGGAGQRLMQIQLAPGFVQQVQQPCDVLPDCTRLTPRQVRPLRRHGQEDQAQVRGVRRRQGARMPCDWRAHRLQVVPGSEKLAVIIEPGMLDGEEIIFAKKGMRSRVRQRRDARAGDQPKETGMRAGDVIFTVRAQKHPIFKRFVERHLVG